jgi:hypothetical protein
MDEARKVIRRLERIEALQTTHAPAAELLGEVRQLLAEGEAWIAAEREGAENHAVAVAGAASRAGATDEAAAALAGCRGVLATRREVVPETADRAAL